MILTSTVDLGTSLLLSIIQTVGRNGLQIQFGQDDKKQWKQLKNIYHIKVEKVSYLREWKDY